MKSKISFKIAIVVCAIMFGSNSLFGQNHWQTGTNPPCPNPDCVDATNNLLGTPTGIDLRFGTNGGSERMRITSPGFVGIGVSNPLSLLHLNTTTTGNLFRTDGLSTNLNQWQLFTGGTEKFRLSVLRVDVI